MVHAGCDAQKNLSGGRKAYYWAPGNTLIIVNPNNPDNDPNGGTAFQPAEGKAKFDGLT